MALVLTGVPKHWAHFVFCHFLGFLSTYRGTSDLPLTALEICYMIAKSILKIDLIIAVIIEIKVGTHHLEIDILLLHRIKKNDFGVTGANFDLNYFSYF